MRCALYARVSSSDQRCDSQLRELRDFAARQGWSVHAEYIDQGVSGKKTSRPELDAMLADAKRKRFDIIVCWKIDRLMRSLRGFSNLMDDLEMWGIHFVSITQPIDTRSPVTGKLIRNIIAAVAEFELDTIRERIRSGIAAKRERGEPVGKPVQFAPKVYAPLVRRHMDAGKTIRAIAEELGMSRETVRRLAK